MTGVSSEDVGLRRQIGSALTMLRFKINKFRDLGGKPTGEHHSDGAGRRNPLKVTVGSGIVATGDLTLQPDPPAIAKGFVDFGGERCRIVVRDFQGERFCPGKEGERHSVLLTHSRSSCSSVGGTTEGTGSPGCCDSAVPGEPFTIEDDERNDNGGNSDDHLATRSRWPERAGFDDDGEQENGHGAGDQHALVGSDAHVKDSSSVGPGGGSPGGAPIVGDSVVGGPGSELTPPGPAGERTKGGAK